MKAKVFYLVLVSLFVLISFQKAYSYTITFEGLPDSTPVTNQYSSLGVLFSNATVLTAGISLNEFEFPPHSGVNVVFDDGGPMTLNFTTPVLNVGGFFTYTVPLTLSFYDGSNNLEGTVNSAFSSNLALSGDPGSSPNEFLSFAWPSGIARAVFAGDPAGGSFVLDDLTATLASGPVPEPGTLLLLGSGVLGIVSYGFRKAYSRRF